MPMRAFTCRACGLTKRYMQSLREDSLPSCSCGGETFRDYAEESTGRSPTGVFATPIEMYSIAMTPDEVPAFKQKCPDVDVATEGEMAGVPIARTRSQKLRALKAMGFQER